MEEDSPRAPGGRWSAGAAAVGAAALLVMSFGPAALALSPSEGTPAPATTTGEVWISPWVEDAGASEVVFRDQYEIS